MKNNKTKQIILSITVIILLTILFLFVGNEFVIDTNSLDIGEIAQDFELDKESNLQIIYFYVGDADCILVKDNKDVMLIDAGEDGDGKYIVEYLKKLGIDEIKYLIGTHEHADHIGGMDYIIDNFYVHNIFIPESKGKILEQYQQVIEASNLKKYKIKSIEQNYTWNLGDTKCLVKYVGNKQSNPNNNSIVLQLENNNQKYLFTGDIEKMVENKIKWDDIDVLKVSHHGSNTSTTNKFLKETRPEISIISSGNTKNIMDDIVVNRLKAISTVYFTKDSSIYLTNDNGNNIIKKLNTKVDSKQH